MRVSPLIAFIGRRGTPARTRGSLDLFCSSHSLASAAGHCADQRERWGDVHHFNVYPSQPQVGSPHLVLSGDLPRWAFHFHPALRENIGVIAQGERQMDVLFYQYDSESLFAKGLQREEKLLRQQGRQS